MTKFIDIVTKDASLRSYQQDAKEAIFASWDEVDSVMFQMPTGTGKTRLFSSIIRDIHDNAIKNKQFYHILIVAHRTELLEQIHDNLRNHYRISTGYIAGGHPRERQYHVQIASIQTISHPNNRQYAQSLKFDYVIIDEAHHAMADTYQLLWKLYPHAKRLGVTATPYRLSGCGFAKLFDRLIMSWTVKKFIEEKYLSSYKYFSLKPSGKIQRSIDNIDEYALDGDYKTAALERVMDRGTIRAQLWDSYNTLVRGKKGIIYAICQAHSAHICEEFGSKGISIKSIDSKTPAKERKQLVEDFKKGVIEVLVNVDIFSEGFDCPDIEFVQLARPTCSMAKYLQQVGRALRPCDGKDAAIILDNVGMYSRFGLPDANRQWNRHFLGNNKSVEELSSWIQKKGDGIGKVFQLKEGTEPMVLVQQSGDIPITNSDIETPQVETANINLQKIITRKEKNIYYLKDKNGSDFVLYMAKGGECHLERLAKNNHRENCVRGRGSFSFWFSLGLFENSKMLIEDRCYKEIDWQWTKLHIWHNNGDEETLYIDYSGNIIEDLQEWEDDYEEEIKMREENYDDMTPQEMKDFKASWNLMSNAMRYTTSVIENVVSHSFRVNKKQTKLLVVEQLSSMTSNILMSIDKTDELMDFLSKGYPIEILGKYQRDSWPNVNHSCIIKYKVKDKWYYTDFLNTGTHPKDSIIDEIYGDVPEVEPVKDVQSERPARDGKRWTVAEEEKLIKLYQQGVAYADIANLLCRTEVAICARLQDKGYIQYDKDTKTYIQLSEDQAVEKNEQPLTPEPKKDYSQIVNKYCDLFKAIKNSTRDGEGSPHKFVMMIAVMNCVCANVAHKKNLIRYNIDLENAFNTVWKKYVNSTVFHPNAPTPFYYLNNEPFWKLIIKTSAAIISNLSSPTATAITRTYEGAEIDMDLYEAIQDPEAYTQLKAVLVQKIKDCKR